MSITSKLNQALNRIGNANGHAFPENTYVSPPGVNNVQAERAYQTEKLLHEYMVAKHMEGYARSRKSEAEKALMSHEYLEGYQFHGLVDAVNEAETHTMYLGSVYTVTVSKKNASERLDKTKLKVELQKSGMSPEQVEKLLSKCSTKSKPATTITVSENV